MQLEQYLQNRRCFACGEYISVPGQIDCHGFTLARDVVGFHEGTLDRPDFPCREACGFCCEAMAQLEFDREGATVLPRRISRAIRLMLAREEPRSQWVERWLRGEYAFETRVPHQGQGRGLQAG